MNADKMKTQLPASTSRRDALWWLGCATFTAMTAGCGGGGSDAEPEPVLPPPPPGPPAPPPPPGPMDRVKAALARPALARDERPVEVSQGGSNSAASSLGVGVVVQPPWDNPSGLTLATIESIWGDRRDRWRWPAGGGTLGGHRVYPIINGPIGLHFRFDGAAFEIAFSGTEPRITLVADGRLMAPGQIRTTLSGGVPGAPLSTTNTLTRFDFGTRAPREVSAYVWSSYGPSAIAVAAGDTLEPWDRSGEASFAVMADSYAAGISIDWPNGPFWEAAAQMGLVHLHADAIGGTGYAPNGTNASTRDPANAFPARLPRIVDAQPDLFLTCGGLNDNNSEAVAGLYATGEEARVAFEAAVNRYYRELRAALPHAVLAATGPWAPRQTSPTEPRAQSKLDTIRNALAGTAGPWVLLDNLNGGWLTSAGTSAPPDGPWQTTANAPLYISDGTHPTQAGNVYLGTRIASGLRAALATL